MKTTKKSRGDEYPKPESAPEPATAVVLFKSGATLTLEFTSRGSADLQARKQFVAAYTAWVTGASKIPGGEYVVSDWGMHSSPPDHQQRVVIQWENVLAINHAG